MCGCDITTETVYPTYVGADCLHCFIITGDMRETLRAVRKTERIQVPKDTSMKS